jgi:hypothetical protein
MKYWGERNGVNCASDGCRNQHPPVADENVAERKFLVQPWFRRFLHGALV